MIASTLLAGAGFERYNLSKEDKVPNLAEALAKEFEVSPERILLLRHFKGKLKAIEAAGAEVDEFTLTQPKDTPYDFRAEGKEPVELVVSISGDHVHAVFRIRGLEAEGSNRVITSTSFRALDGAMKYPERIVRRFKGSRLKSKWVGGTVTGWTNPRLGVARAGGKLFGSVKVTLPKA